jgi:hypothetical protein
MRTKFTVFSLCLIFLWGAVKTNAQDKKSGPEKFTGRALVVGSPTSGATTWFTLFIQEYTSDEDTLKYVTILKEQGQQAFKKALGKIEVGWIAPTGQTREPVNIARSHDVEGGRWNLP